MFSRGGKVLSLYTWGSTLRKPVFLCTPCVWPFCDTPSTFFMYIQTRHEVRVSWSALKERSTVCPILAKKTPWCARFWEVSDFGHHALFCGCFCPLLCPVLSKRSGCSFYQRRKPPPNLEPSRAHVKTSRYARVYLRNTWGFTRFDPSPYIKKAGRERAIEFPKL